MDVRESWKRGHVWSAVKGGLGVVSENAGITVVSRDGRPSGEYSGRQSSSPARRLLGCVAPCRIEGNVDHSLVG